MKIDILTLFPEMFDAVKHSILARAEKKGLLEINLHNIRDFSKDNITRLMIHLLVVVQAWL